MVCKTHKMTLENLKNGNSQIVKTSFAIAHCHLWLYHHVKIYEKYEWLSLYIMMTKNWYSLNKSKTSTNKLWW